MVSDPKPPNKKFNRKAVEKILCYENKFLTNLFSILPIPISAQRNDDFEQRIDQSKLNTKPTDVLMNSKSRAKSLEELQNRLDSIKGIKKLNYKEKLAKKTLKNQLKKKTKREERKTSMKIVRAHKTNEKNDKQENEITESKPKLAEPVYNSEGKMVFSKFDFAGLGRTYKKKTETDPKKILQKLKEQKTKLAELEKSGDKDKAIELKQKYTWKNALAKAEGQKVKDDPILLKKSIKRTEQMKKKSQEKWKKREETVKQGQADRQKKRTENIEKRKKDKKTGKLKRAAKRGRIIPGF